MTESSKLVAYGEPLDSWRKKMTDEEIQFALEVLVRHALERGVKRPDANLSIRANARVRVELEWYTDEHDEKADEYKWQWFYADAAQSALDAASRFVLDYPSGAERKKLAFTKVLARTIELGKANDVEVATLNPLIELMEKLSANAIEDHRTPVGKAIDDEILF